MKSAWFALVETLALAVGYYLLARLCFLLAVEPGNVSPIWLPSGLALAWLWLRGRYLLIGVFVGSWVANWTMPACDGWIATVIAFGSTLQTSLALFLMTRFARRPGEPLPQRVRELVYYLAIALFTPSIAATLGVGGLYLGNYVSWSRVVPNWTIWWLGDASGYLLLTPLLLVAASHRAKQRPPEWYVFLLASLLVGLGAVAEFLLVHRHRVDEEHIYREQASNVLEQINHAGHTIQFTVSSIESLFNVAGTVSRQGFHQYCQELLRHNPWLQALEWIPRIPQEEKQQWEQLAIADGYSNFRIYEKHGGVIGPVTPRPFYFPVFYLEPYQGNEMALGFDLGSQPTRLRALENAWTSGKPALSAPVYLVQDLGEQYGVLLSVPIYRGGPPGKDLQQRRNNLLGFALGVIRIKDMLSGALNAHYRQGLDILLKDMTWPEPERNLAWLPWSPGENASLLSQRLLTPTDELTQEYLLPIAGREWLLQVRPSAQRMALILTPTSQGIPVLVSLLLAGLVVLYGHLRQISDAVLRQERNTLADRVEHRTAELASLNADLLQTQARLIRQDQALRQNIQAITESALFNQSILDSIEILLIIVDGDGTIIALNRAWQLSAKEGGLEPRRVGIGTSYLEPLDRAFQQGEYSAGEAAAGVRAVLSGEKTTWSLHFTFQVEEQRNWFFMRVARLAGLAEPKVVITYENVSRLVAAYESQGRYEEHFHRSVQDSLLPKLLYTEDGTIHLLNQAWYNASGYGPVGTLEEWTQLALGSQGQVVALALRTQAILPVATHDGEFTLITAAGQTRIWDFYSEPVGEQQDGQRLRLITALDITEQRTASQEKNRILEMSRDLIASLSPEGELHFINAAWQRRLGYPPQALVDHSLLDILHPHDRESLNQAFTKLVRGENLHHLETRLLAEDGELVWIVWQATFDPGTNLIYGVGRDVTERHYWEEEQAAALRRYTSLVAALGDITYELRVRTRRIQWDGSYNVLLGYDKASMGQQLTDWRQRIHPDDLIAVETAFTRACQEHQVLEVEYRARHAAGHYLWLQERTSILCNPDGAPLIAMGVLKDVTQRRNQENTRKQAEQTPQTQQAFVTHVSHEMRTPLTALLGFAERLRATDPKEREQALQAVLTSSQHLQRLVTDILDLSEAESGQLTLTQQTVNLQNLLTHWFDEFNPLAQAKGLTLAVQGIPPLPRTFISDPQRLAQLLDKLGDNAIRFTNQGSVRLLVSCDSVNERLVLALFDSGQGMENPQAERVFQPFVQGDDSPHRAHGGLGLGLSLARHLAQQLGDDLQLQSHPGAGTLFTVTIATGPLDSSNLDETFALELPDLSITPLVPLTIPQVVGQILLAEDNDYNQTLISHHLTRTGATVVVAVNGEEAVSFAMENDFQLILMDMQMPIMGGLEATRMLRDTLYPGPIVALTAHGQSYHRQEALEAGCDDFLTKPVDWAALYQVVARYLPTADSAIVSTPPVATNDDLVAALAARFRADFPATLEQLSRALDQEDLSQAAGLAHQIKGVAGSLGYPALGAAARTIETAARAGDTLATAAALAELRRVAEL